MSNTQNITLLCNLEYQASFNWELIIAILALIIAIFTILISSRFQILTYINAQLIEIAKTCNSYLQDDYQVHKNNTIKQGRASGIVTALEDAEKIIKQYIKESTLIFKRDEIKLKKLFYNHLHSSIKVILKDYQVNNGTGFNFETKIDSINKIIIYQLGNSCKYFENEIRETWDFEKNREKTLKLKKSE